MPTKREGYRERLRDLDPEAWEAFLLAESGLPGPRGNVELGRAVADEGTAEQFLEFLAHDPETAPTGTAEEYLPFCGTVGLGRLIAEGQREHRERLREQASDPRWRVREAVAMALQRLGDADVDALLDVAEAWAAGNHFEGRAAVAGVCEPRLLDDPDTAERVFGLLDAVTGSVESSDDRDSDGFEALRKGLGYCWSVAVVAYPEPGRERFEAWLDSEDRDVRWILRENLSKARLSRLDAAWVETCRERLEAE